MMYYFLETMGIIHHFSALKFQGFKDLRKFEEDLTIKQTRVNITQIEKGWYKWKNY